MPKKPIFIVNKHAASHLHYDFRISVGKILKSWAIPKGISSDPSQKRLAIPTPDHEYSYAKFEGIIPPGKYGAGTVMIWDKGTYKNIKRKDGKIVPIKQCIKDGHIEIWLEGKKLKGGYAPIKTNMNNGKKWLILKMNDEFANKKFKNENKSVISEKTMQEIK